MFFTYPFLISSKDSFSVSNDFGVPVESHESVLALLKGDSDGATSKISL